MTDRIAFLDHLRGSLPRLESVLRDDPRRATLEAFVRAVFRRGYAADVTHFAPELLGDIDAEGRVHAVLGLRPAADGALFCEAYLDRPVEQLIAGLCDRPLSRDEIVEIAHLAPEHAGQARALIAALTRHLHARGVNWVVFTAVPRLRNAFCRMGLEPLPLAPADPARLPRGEAARWGRYYDVLPVVYAGDVMASHASLMRSARILDGLGAA